MPGEGAYVHVTTVICLSQWSHDLISPHRKARALGTAMAALLRRKYAAAQRQGPRPPRGRVFVKKTPLRSIVTPLLGLIHRTTCVFSEPDPA